MYIRILYFYEKFLEVFNLKTSMNRKKEGAVKISFYQNRNKKITIIQRRKLIIYFQSLSNKKYDSSKGVYFKIKNPPVMENIRLIIHKCKNTETKITNTCYFINLFITGI